MTGLVNRVVLTGMIRSACELADLGLHAAADKITEAVGAASERLGCDVGELFAPLWADTKPNTAQEA